MWQFVTGAIETSLLCIKTQVLKAEQNKPPPTKNKVLTLASKALEDLASGELPGLLSQHSSLVYSALAPSSFLVVSRTGPAPSHLGGGRSAVGMLF